MFGIDPRVRLTTSNLPDDVFDIINVDDDLENFTDTQTRRKVSINQESAGIFFTSLISAK